METGGNTYIVPMYVAYLIAHPDDPTHAHATRDHCVAMGMPPPRLIPGIRPYGSSPNQSITSIHLKVIATAIREGCVE
jgi:hypothetical protein